MPFINSKEYLHENLYYQYAERIKEKANDAVRVKLGAVPKTPPSHIKGFRKAQTAELAKYPEYEIIRNGGTVDSPEYDAFVDEIYEKRLDEAVKATSLPPPSTESSMRNYYSWTLTKSLSQTRNSCTRKQRKRSKS